MAEPPPSAPDPGPTNQLASSGGPPNPRKSPETSPNKLMVFSAKSKSPEGKKHHPKMVVKHVTAKLRSRKSTPAQPTKDGGRKRLIASPFADDKQIRKKIDFGSEDVGEMNAGMAREPSQPGHEKNSGTRTSSVVNSSPSTSFPASDSSVVVMQEPVNNSRGRDPLVGQLVGDGDMAGGMIDETNALPTDPRGVGDVVAPTIVPFAANFPEKEVHPKSNLEKQIVPCNIGLSRDGLEKGDQVQPAFSLIHLANPHSADELDKIMAQPLLAGEPLEVNTSEKMLLTTQPPLLLGDTEMDVAENLRTIPYAAPIDQFPPLTKGRIRKICNTFEMGANTKWKKWE